MRWGQAVSALALLFAIVPCGAAAQSVRPPTREELQVGEPERRDAEPQPRVTVESDIERGPCPLADPAYGAVTVNFARIDFADIKAVSSDLLAPAWQGYAGRDIPIARLCEIRDRAATILRRQGYLAAVQVPPQRIERGGSVRMDVLVARLAEVQVRGDAGRSEALIAAHVAKLTRDEYFNIDAAERHLLLLGDLPGFDVRLTLRPADKPGEVFGDILVVRRPLEIIGGLQNLGSKAAGRFGVVAQATLNDVTGLGDRTVVSLYNTVQTSEQTVLQFAHDLALGTDGWRLGGSLVYGRSRPTLPGNARIKSESLIGRIDVSYPFVRRQAMTLRGAAGAEIVNQNVDFGGIRVSEDHLRVAFVRLDFDLIDKGSLSKRAGYSDNEPLWRIAGSIEARKGFGAFGASTDCTPIAKCTGPKPPISNFLAEPQAALVRLEAVAEYRPEPSVTVVLAPRAQYTAKALLGYEQFSLGNYTIGRGLDPGAIQGDGGLGTSLELRFGQRRYRKVNSLAVLPYAFVDAAWAWSNDGGLTGDPRRALTAGGGARIAWGDRIESNIMLAFPLERVGTQARRGDVRLLFSLAARIAP